MEVARGLIPFTVFRGSGNCEAPRKGEKWVHEETGEVEEEGLCDPTDGAYRRDERYGGLDWKVRSAVPLGSVPVLAHQGEMLLVQWADREEWAPRLCLSLEPATGFGAPAVVHPAASPVPTSLADIFRLVWTSIPADSPRWWTTMPGGERPRASTCPGFSVTVDLQEEVLAGCLEPRDARMELTPCVLIQGFYVSPRMRRRPRRVPRYTHLHTRVVVLHDVPVEIRHRMDDDDDVDGLWMLESLPTFRDEWSFNSFASLVMDYTVHMARDGVGARAEDRLCQSLGHDAHDTRQASRRHWRMTDDGEELVMSDED